MEKKPSIGKKNNPSKDFPYIQIRITPEEKANWLKYSKENNYKTITAFINDVVRDRILKGKQNGDYLPIVTDLTKMVKDLQEKINKMESEAKQKVDQILLEKENAETIKKTEDYKGSILHLLEINPLTSEVIAELMHKKEIEILPALKDLVSHNLVKQTNRKGKVLYEVVKNGN